MTEEVKQTSVAFGKTELDIVNAVAQRTGINNFSAALRMIIRSWNKQNQDRGMDAWIPEDLTVDAVTTQES